VSYIGHNRAGGGSEAGDGMTIPYAVVPVLVGYKS
jgi:hypothetical protein